MADPLFDFATFATTACAASAAAFAAFISYKVAAQSAYPDVVVYSAQDEHRPSIIVLVIENIGRAPAYRVVFRPDQAIPTRAWGLDSATAKAAEKMAAGPLISGIPFLPPGGKRVLTWGQFGGLAASLSAGMIQITAEYYPKDSIVGPIPLLRTTSIIDIESHRDTDASDADPLSRIAKALEKRNAHLGIK